MPTTVNGQPNGGFVDTKKGALIKNLGTSVLRVKCLEFTNNGMVTASLSVYQDSIPIGLLTLLPGWSKVYSEQRFLNQNSSLDAVCNLANTISWRINFE